MRLFTYEGYKVAVSPEALMLKPFRLIWERDKSRDKTKALIELSVVYFLCDVRSDYQHIIDQDERLKMIVRDVGLPVKYKPDKLLVDAFKFYSSFKTSATLLLEDTRLAVEKMRQTLREMEVTKADLKAVADTVQKLINLIQELDKAEKAIARESATETKARGSIEKTILDDDLD